MVKKKAPVIDEYEVIQYSEKDLDIHIEKALSSLTKHYEEKMDARNDLISSFTKEIDVIRKEMRVVLFANIAFSLCLIYLFLPVIGDVFK